MGMVEAAVLVAMDLVVGCSVMALGETEVTHEKGTYSLQLRRNVVHEGRSTAERRRVDGGKSTKASVLTGCCRSLGRLT
ncbi:hypothetical protein TorRG33x02_216150 [Trema orientale]|uniref:Secreted protein n=1 Tax=Trema orientale TaxID=63057 RepID=A0A2P5EAR0_TREOI|nr:hypothetical protein TorRG33x02_216150 [Trema orientale]